LNTPGQSSGATMVQLPDAQQEPIAGSVVVVV
jgi:hypothetical protein